MRRLKRLISGIVLMGLGFGIVQTPLSLAACNIARQEKMCCCPPSAVKSDCCPVKKRSDCPALNKTESAPLAVIPTHPQLSFVAFVEPLVVTAQSPRIASQTHLLLRGPAPPNAFFLRPASLRSPPALA